MRSNDFEAFSASIAPGVTNCGATFAWRIDASALMEMVPRVEEARLHYAAFRLGSLHPILESRECIISVGKSWMKWGGSDLVKNGMIQPTWIAQGRLDPPILTRGWTNPFQPEVWPALFSQLGLLQNPFYTRVGPTDLMLGPAHSIG